MNNEPPQVPSPSEQPSSTPRVLGLVSMILGIVSIVTTFLSAGLLFIPSIVLAIAAIVTGIIALVKKAPKGQAISGIATGGAVLLFCAALIIFFASIFTAWGNYYENRDEEMRQERIQTEERVESMKKNFSQGETGEFSDISFKVLGSREGDDSTNTAGFRVYEVEIQNTNGTKTFVSPDDFKFLSGGRKVALATAGPNSFERIQLDKDQTITTEFAINSSEVTESMWIEYNTSIKTTKVAFTIKL